jgi:hypothetical protein
MSNLIKKVNKSVLGAVANLMLNKDIDAIIAEVSVPVDDSLLATEDSCCVDLDATLSAGYDNDNTILNLVPTPADGSPTSAYHMWRGSTAASQGVDPTMVNIGTTSAHWLFDGSDYFTSINSVAAQPTFYKEIAQTSGTGANAYWFATCFRISNADPTSDRLWGNAFNNTNVGAGLRINTDDIILEQHVNTNNNIPLGTNNLTKNVDHFLMITADLSLVGQWNVNYYLDSATPTSVAENYDDSTSDETDGIWRLGATDNAGTVAATVPNGVKIYAFAAGNAFLTPAEVSAIRVVYETRHNRTYI